MFRFAPVQSEFGRRAADYLGIDPRDPSTFVVILDGRVLVRSDGALELLRRLPGWRWCAVLMWIPRPLRDWIYDRIARNRYRVFGRTNECLVPSPELANHLATALTSVEVFRESKPGGERADYH